MGNGFTFFLGGAFEDGEQEGVDVTTHVLNHYVSYETGAWIFVAEFNYGLTEAEGGMINAEADSLSGMLMANFAYSEQASVTGRLSFVDFDPDFAPNYEQTKMTLAHNYAFTDA